MMKHTIKSPLTTARAVGDAILAAPQYPMDEKTADIMMWLLTAPDDFRLPPGERPFSYKVAERRMAHHGVPADEKTLLMIAALSTTPGEVVMYCAVLKALTDRLGHIVKIHDLCNAFPVGFPDRQSLEEIWDRQKVNDGGMSDNWLDRSVAWRSEPA